MFGWFKSSHQVAQEAAHKARISDLESKIVDLGDERHKLKAEVEDLKIQRKVEDENMRHLVKMKDEKREIEYQKKELDAQRDKDARIAAVKDQYRDKLEGFLQAEIKNVRGMYDEILKRLPDVNVALTGKVK